MPEYDGGSKITHYVVERRDITHQVKSSIIFKLDGSNQGS